MRHVILYMPQKCWNARESNNFLAFCHHSHSSPQKVSLLVQVGFSHSNILRSVIHHACLRFPNLASHNEASAHLPRRSKSLPFDEAFNKREGIRKIFVLFGGDTSERQVSLMSGTNVWLNLLAFDEVSLGNISYKFV